MSDFWQGRACPECDLDSGIYADFMGTVQCDNCGWVDK